MRKLNVLLLSLLCSYNLSAQSNNVEAEIKDLEQMEVKAVLAKDTVTLKKLWDANFIVHNPEGKIVPAVSNSTSRPVLNRPRTSFAREVEQVTVNGNVVFSMGSETVGLVNDNSASEQVIKRRYTNVWIRKDGVWKLTARHANIICAGK